MFVCLFVTVVIQLCGFVILRYKSGKSYIRPVEVASQVLSWQPEAQDIPLYSVAAGPWATRERTNRVPYISIDNRIDLLPQYYLQIYIVFICKETGLDSFFHTRWDKLLDCFIY